MKLKHIIPFIAVAALCSCNTASKAIESASQKSLVGNGFMTINKITVTDSATNTYTPQIFSMFLNGQYVSLLKNGNFLFYDRKESASTFNASAKTIEENLVIQTDGKATIADVIAKLAELEKAKADETETTETTATTETATETPTATESTTETK